MGTSQIFQVILKGSTSPWIFPSGVIRQVIPLLVLLSMVRLFSTHLKTAITACWRSAASEPDQESLVMFTIRSAPFATNPAHTSPKTSS